MENPGKTGGKRMISEVIFSLCMNISILAVIAAFLTERTFFRGLLFFIWFFTIEAFPVALLTVINTV